jgi:hypothetical protein
MAAKKPVKRVAKAGPNVQGGKFKGKDSINLSKKELGNKGTAAASKRTVDISKTKHKKEGPNKGKVVGPKGNPLTGKVDMGGGNMAVYKDGKRVTSRTAKKAASPRSGGGVTPAQAKAKAAAAAAKSGGKTSAQLKAAAAAKEKAASKAKAEAKKIAIDKARKADTAKRKSPKAKDVKTTTAKPDPKSKPLIKDTSKDSTKPRSSYDAQGKLYHEMFYLGQWRRVKQNSDGKWMPTTS